MNQKENEILSLLVKMADEFDQTGDHDLAANVDKTITSMASRRTPLKELDDETKKNLIIFIHDANQNTSKSVKGLKELFRRLRYFDLVDSIKDLGLDRVVKDMSKTQECLDGAKKKFFELIHGKKPSRQDLEKLFDTLSDAAEKSGGPLDFFESQLKKEIVDSENEDSDDEEENEDTEEDEKETEIDEESLKEFWSDLENYKDKEE